MAYVTAAEVASWLGAAATLQLTTESGNIADLTKISGLIGPIEGRVHGFIGRRVTTPVTQADSPQLYAAIKGIVTDWVIYKLASRRPPVPAEWKDAYVQAIKWLEGFEDGSIAIPDSTDNEPLIEQDANDQNLSTMRDEC